MQQPPTATSAAGLAQSAAASFELSAPTALDAPAGYGLPHERHTRIAARRTFVALKQRFMVAIDDVSGRRADWLRLQVRQAEEPVDLWLLRGLVFEALESEGTATERTRLELKRELDSVFPDGGELLPYGVRRSG